MLRNGIASSGCVVAATPALRRASYCTSKSFLNCPIDTPKRIQLAKERHCKLRLCRSCYACTEKSFVLHVKILLYCFHCLRFHQEGGQAPAASGGTQARASGDTARGSHTRTAPPTPTYTQRSVPYADCTDGLTIRNTTLPTGGVAVPSTAMLALNLPSGEKLTPAGPEKRALPEPSAPVCTTCPALLHCTRSLARAGRVMYGKAAPAPGGRRRRSARRRAG